MSFGTALSIPAQSCCRPPCTVCPELYRQKIGGADLVANPGCYPTSAVFALLPAVEERLIDESRIVIDSKSGLSGAGRKLIEAALLCTRQENVAAYSIASHRHTPEMEQELQAAGGGADLRVGFTPHYMPMSRGILTTAYAPPDAGGFSGGAACSL